VEYLSALKVGLTPLSCKVTFLPLVVGVMSCRWSTWKHYMTISTPKTKAQCNSNNRNQTHNPGECTTNNSQLQLIKKHLNTKLLKVSQLHKTNRTNTNFTNKPPNPETSQTSQTIHTILSNEQTPKI